MKCGFRGNVRGVADERGRAAPPDLDASEQIGLRARHLEHPGGVEPRLRPKDLRVGQEAHLRAATIERLTDDGEPARRLSARESLAIKRLAPSDLDFELLGQRVHDRDANAVKPARGLVGAAVELSARVQHRHDHFEGRFLWKFGVWVDRHAAAVVDHAQVSALLERDLDESRVAGDGFVHRIVDHFCEEVMERVGIGAPHVHPRAPAHRLQPLEHFDRGGGVVRFVRRSIAGARLAVDRRGLAASGRCRAKKIVHVLCHNPANCALFKLPRVGENENRTLVRNAVGV